MSGFLDLSDYIYPDASMGRQPQLPFSINWDDECTDGLVSVVFPGICRYDLVSGQLLANTTGTVANGIAAQGKTLDETVSNAGIYATAGPTQRNGSASIVWLGDLYASPSGDACLGGITYNSANINPYINIELKRNYSNSNASKVYLSLSTGGSPNNGNLQSSGNYTSGTNFMFVGVASPGFQALYSGKIGGKLAQDATTVVAGNLSASSTSRIEIGDSLNARNPQSRCAAQFIYNRPLAQSQIDLLAANPMRIVKGQIDIAIFVPASAPGGLVASPVTTLPAVIGTPSLAQNNVLSATAVTTLPAVIGTPSLAQNNALTASPVATLPVVVGAPVITQAQALTATAVSTLPVTVGPPSLTQNNALTVSPVATHPVVGGAPGLTIPGELAALPVATLPAVVGTPTLAQNNALTTTAVATLPVVVGAPVLSVPGNFVALPVATLPVVVGSPVLSQMQQFIAQSINTQPIIVGQPVLTSGPVVGSPAQLILTTGKLATISPLLQRVATIQAGVLNRG